MNDNLNSIRNKHKEKKTQLYRSKNQKESQAIYANENLNSKLKSKLQESQIDNKYKNQTKSHINILSSPKLVREYDMFNKENLKLKNDIENQKLIKSELESKINRLTVMSEQNKVLNLKSEKAHDLE